ncbi:succinylglutamate desuccinylase/aspartoacylase family protein [Candidatus Uhrbacteria bacterium]|nr:succinylglutamate desuccinylase/aspartoacylase family protein [Candidatus Uhrbacteria bacterium]
MTAGMDGDEYAGMEAAYRLIDRLGAGEFSGRVIVVPVVNAPGFAAECSQNPLDGLLPKMRGLGRPNGSPTDRLLSWLSTYIRQAECGYDMHGGALTEGLQPFLWLHRVPGEADALHAQIVESRLAETIVDERAMRISKAEVLAREGRAYILAESGARGERRPEDIERHLRWVHGVMALMGMVDGGVTPVAEARVFHRVKYYVAPFDGIWRAADARKDIRKGEAVGTCTRLDGTGAAVIRFRQNGIRLWWKETMALRKGDVVCAVAYNETKDPRNARLWEPFVAGEVA